MNIEPRVWLWLIAASLFVWIVMITVLEAVVRAVA